MQAFKLYFKVYLRSCLVPTSIYFVVFSILAVLFTRLGGNSVPTDFDTTKYRVVIINEDASAFSHDLEEYIGEHSKVIQINTDENSIRDALFFRDAEYVLTIPSGYGDAFLQGNPIELKTQSIPNAVAGTFMDMLVDNYLNTYELYLTGAPDMSVQEITSAVRKDLSVSTAVDMQQTTDLDTLSAANRYFNYSAYIYMAVIIQAVSMIMLIMNEKDVRRRNLCSPLRMTSFSFQIFAGNALLCMAFWVMFCLYSVLLYGEAVSGVRGLLYFLNSLVFALVCLAISFLVANLVSKRAVSPIMNTISLGCSFLGGAFVPQSMLSDTVKTIAVGNPTFWFIKANNHIGSLSVFDMEALEPVFKEMLILLLFAAAFLAIALVAVKNRRTSE